MTHSFHLLLRLLVLRIKSVYLYITLALVLLLLCMSITEIEPCNWQQHPINEQPESNRSAMHSICPFSPSPTQSSQNSVNMLEPIVISLRYQTKWQKPAAIQQEPTKNQLDWVYYITEHTTPSMIQVPGITHQVDPWRPPF